MQNIGVRTGTRLSAHRFLARDPLRPTARTLRSKLTMPSDRSDGSSKRDLRGASLGLELAAALVGFTLVGFWIDHTYDTSPWGTVACAVLGLVGGFYNFIRSSLTILRQPPTSGSPRDSTETKRDSTR